MDAQTEEVNFRDWLIGIFGPCQWMVGRSSKKRRKQGYDRFFTQKMFSGLKRVYEQEMSAMETGALKLTTPNADLAEKQKRTPHGMAFWAATGPKDTTCRECSFWLSEGWLADAGTLKDSICGKYRAMMNGEAGSRLPHYTPSCKYFSRSDSARPIKNPKI